MDIIKYDMTDIWAVAGDVVAPDSAKVRAGWGVEVVPRQWWNWFENRQDNNIAYMLQKGFPEWDATTEYIINKSYVQRNGVVYRATATSTNSDPVALTSWVKAFADSTAASEALAGVTPAANTMPYFTGASAASTTALSAFGRSIAALVDAAAARTLIGAQLANNNLTALSGVTPNVNVLPYFTSTTVMSGTIFTAFARTLLDDVDAPAMRSTLGVYSTTESDNALAAGLATKQPLAANLTNLAALTIVSNSVPFYDAASTLGLAPSTTFGRGFLNLTDASAARSYIGANDASNLTTGTVALARIPTNLTGINAATATALQTSRTIQGVPFNGTANITLSVVDKDSSTGSAVLPAGTSAQRTASPSNGMIRYNSDTNEFEGYQNGAWAGIGGGTPLYTVLWWPNRASIPTGYLPADGQLLSRTSYQAAFAGVNSGILPVVTDAVWLATSTSRGCYSTGDGSTNFRIPDLNGQYAGTVAAPFLRGDGTNSAGTPGTFQQDTFQNHQVSFLAANVSGATGAPFQTVMVGGAGGLEPTTGSTNYRLGLSSFTTASGFGTPRTSQETRPTNVTGVFVIKLIGGASDLSQEDASVAVAALDAKLAYVGGRNRIINGDCRVAQRATAVLGAGQVAYGGPDRYLGINNGTGIFSQVSTTMTIGGAPHTCIAQQVGATLPTSFTSGNYWGGICQLIEGTNAFDLLGVPVTLSFYFTSTVAGTYSVALRDGVGGRSYVSSFTVAASTPTKIVVNIPAIPTAATVPNTTASGLIINIGAINTGTYQAPSINGWLTGSYFTAPGSVNWAQVTNTSLIAATQIQLEAGTAATPFERLAWSTQLVNCQRYYQVVTTSARWPAYANQQVLSVPLPYMVTMRAAPTLVYNGSIASANVFTYAASSSTNSGGVFTLTNNVAGDTYMLGTQWGASAEL